MKMSDISLGNNPGSVTNVLLGFSKQLLQFKFKVAKMLKINFPIV